MDRTHSILHLCRVKTCRAENVIIIPFSSTLIGFLPVFFVLFCVFLYFDFKLLNVLDPDYKFCMAALITTIGYYNSIIQEFRAVI